MQFCIRKALESEIPSLQPILLSMQNKQHNHAGDPTSCFSYGDLLQAMADTEALAQQFLVHFTSAAWRAGEK